MPTWLLIVNTVIGALLGVASLTLIWDKFFRTRTGSQLETSLDSLKVHSWTLPERLNLEHRLTDIEKELSMLTEIHEVLEQYMAKILHSPHRQELDRLLEKIEGREELTNAELMFALDWLYEIAEDKAAAKGERNLAAGLIAILSVKAKYKEAGSTSH